MPNFHFKLVDTRIVSDHGVHDLADETAAQIEAIRLARSLRETRSELAGRNYSIHVVDEYGKAVCVIPIDDI
jgi:Mg2+/Co2+ transporter CorC